MDVAYNIWNNLDKTGFYPPDPLRLKYEEIVRAWVYETHRLNRWV